MLGRLKGGRPAYDPVLMFKVLVLQALYSLSDDQAEFQIQDRLSFMRFLLFREHLVQAGAIENLFARFDRHLSRPDIWRWADRLWMPRLSRTKTAQYRC